VGFEWDARKAAAICGSTASHSQRLRASSSIHCRQLAMARMRSTTSYRGGRVVVFGARHLAFPVFLVFLVVLPTERLTLLSPTPYTEG
jgi:hypothetical protein